MMMEGRKAWGDIRISRTRRRRRTTISRRRSTVRPGRYLHERSPTARRVSGDLTYDTYDDPWGGKSTKTHLTSNTCYVGSCLE